MKTYFQQDPLYRHRFSDVWLWSEWASIRSGFDTVNNKLEDIKSELHIVKTDVATLKSEFSLMKKDVEELKNNK